MLLPLALLIPAWAEDAPAPATVDAPEVTASLESSPLPDGEAEPLANAPPLTRSFLSERLDSGMLVSIYTVPELPVVATQTWVAVGAAHESSDEHGFAHLFEHLMFEGTANVERGAYARHHTLHAGYQNAYTSIDATVYRSTIVPEAHDRVLELESDRLAHLVVTEENLAREKKVVFEELQSDLDPRGWQGPLAEPIINALFAGHPYDHRTIGTAESIAAAEMGLMQKFFDGYYHPANIHLVIAGPVDGPTTLARVDALYGGIQKDHLAPPNVPALIEHTFPDRVVVRAPMPRAKKLGRLYLGPQEGHPDHAAYALMVHMLTHIEESPLQKVLITDPKRTGAAWTQTYNPVAGPVLQMSSSQSVARRTSKALRLLEDAVAQMAAEAWMGEAHLEASRRCMLLAELDDAWSADRIASRIGAAHQRWGDARRGLEGNAPALRSRHPRRCSVGLADLDPRRRARGGRGQTRPKTSCGRAAR